MSGTDALTQLMNRARQGDRDADEALMRLIHDELRSLAARHLRREQPGHTLAPTALVNEAYLNLAGGDQAWDSRAHFFGAASRAIRRVLVDHARAKKRLKRGGGRSRRPLTVSIAEASTSAVDLMALDEALTELATLNERHARIVEMRFFGGLSPRDVADALGVSLRTVEADWSMARRWLKSRMGAGPE